MFRTLAVAGLVGLIAPLTVSSAGAATTTGFTNGTMTAVPQITRGQVVVTETQPCVPPAGSTNALAEVSAVLARKGAPVPAGTAKIPLNSTGKWQAVFTFTQTGEYVIDAACLSSPTAEGAYATYSPQFAELPTASVGYYVVGQNTPVADAFGDAGGYPTAPPAVGRLAAPIVGVSANMVDGLGYWAAAADGGVFTVGSAPYKGSLGAIHLNQPIVGIASTRDGQGYWLVARDGGVFTFGEAYFQGSGANDADHSPVVGIARWGFHTGRSYLIARADGSVVDYTADGPVQLNGPLALHAPIVAIAATPSEMGYYLVASDGGVFTAGDAAFGGSLGAIHLVSPITGIAVRNDGGYWLVAGDGGVFTFGGAPFDGSATTARAQLGPVVGIAATPDPLAPLT